tara:strand:+ start:195 stop:602 length:408 start_codon:yes stop_codon:yes gene_type:complete
MMWWQTTKVWLKTAAATCKKYWQVIAGFAAAIFLFVLTRKTPNPKEVLDKSNESHKKEVDAIKSAHELEIRIREEAAKRQKETVAVVEKAFKDADKELTSKKRKQVNKIIKENDGDPDTITKELSKLTGFKIEDH